MLAQHILDAPHAEITILPDIFAYHRYQTHVGAANAVTVRIKTSHLLALRPAAPHLGCHPFSGRGQNRQ